MSLLWSDGGVNSGIDLPVDLSALFGSSDAPRACFHLSSPALSGRSPWGKDSRSGVTARAIDLIEGWEHWTPMPRQSRNLSGIRASTLTGERYRRATGQGIIP